MSESDTVKRKIPIFSKVFLLLRLCQMVTLISLVIIMMSDYKRPPITCLMKPPEKAIETYCYMQGMFTIENYDNIANNYNSYPGLGPKLSHESKKIYHGYFYWIPYMLCFKILFLGFPRLLWKSLKGGLIYKLTRELDTKEPKNIIRSANYFVLTLHSYKRRAIIFLLCEAIGVATILTSMFLTNWFLEGKFLQAIPHLLSSILRVDEIDSVYDELFPKLSKCSFYMFGISGSIVKRDAQCVLARNMLTGRIYTLHFVIFSVAAVIAVLSFSWRILVFLTPKLREIYVIKKMTKPEGRKDDIRYIMRFCDFGDWFFLLQLTCTMSNFDIWLSETKDQLQEREKESLWREMNPEEE